MAHKDSSTPPLRYPDRQIAYQDALFESDPAKFLQLANDAERAIATRLKALPENSDYRRERRAIFVAQGTLRYLRSSMLK